MIAKHAHAENLHVACDAGQMALFNMSLSSEPATILIHAHGPALERPP